MEMYEPSEDNHTDMILWTMIRYCIENCDLNYFLPWRYGKDHILFHVDRFYRLAYSIYNKHNLGSYIVTDENNKLFVKYLMTHMYDKHPILPVELYVSRHTEYFRDSINIEATRYVDLHKNSNVSGLNDWHWNILSAAGPVTVELLRETTNWPWCWKGLLINPNISLRDVLDNQDLPWSKYGINNKMITPEEAVDLIEMGLSSNLSFNKEGKIKRLKNKHDPENINPCLFYHHNGNPCRDIIKLINYMDLFSVKFLINTACYSFKSYKKIYYAKLFCRRFKLFMFNKMRSSLPYLPDEIINHIWKMGHGY
jgi:hypothetical protein